MPGSDRVLTFSGKPATTSMPVRWSSAIRCARRAAVVRPRRQPVTFRARPARRRATRSVCVRPTSRRPGDTTGVGHHCRSWRPPPSPYYWLTGVDVLAPASAGTLVTFGDSITDGDQSTPDTLGMWPAVLATRLQADRATAGVGVVNAGISGNRVLGDNNSGLARLARDVLAVPGVRWMTLLEGHQRHHRRDARRAGGQDVHRGYPDRRLPADDRDRARATASW